MTINIHEIPYNVLSVTGPQGFEKIYRTTPLSLCMSLEPGDDFPIELREAEIFLWVESDAVEESDVPVVSAKQPERPCWEHDIGIKTFFEGGMI